MRILYVSQYYPPETNAPALRVARFAELWREAGHDVTVLTGFPNHPAGVLFEGYRLKPVEVAEIDGIRVVRTYLYPAANRGVLKRSLNYGSFMASAIALGCRRVGDPDVVIGSSPQLLVGVAGWAIARVKKCPFVLEVRDVWPEALGAVSAGNRTLYSMLDRIASFLYARAARIVTVSQGGKETLIRRGVSSEVIEIVPTGIRTDVVKPMVAREEIRGEMRNGADIVVSYVGTHGMAQRLKTVLDAAAKLANEPGIRFVLIGDGAEKPDLLRLREKMGLTNLVMLDQMPRTRALQYTAAADICVAPLRKADLFTRTIPSKIYELMACGKPVVVGVDGEARELVEKAGAGVFVEPEDPDALARAVLKLASDAEARKRLGENGRRYVEANCDKRLLASQYLDILDSMTRQY